MGRKRHFGNVRRRESGRWQVRYRGPDGRMRSAPRTFARKAEAERYLSLVEVQLAQGEWTDPARARVHLRDYAEHWLAERPGLRPRTVSVYRSLLHRHINPELGDVPLSKLDTPLIRAWRAKLLANGVSQTMAAKAYRLLRAILMTAVNEDRILPRNPCRIRGADREQAGERPVLSAAQVLALAAAVPGRYRAMILTATFASLRFGEVTALRRSDVDLVAGAVRVARAFGEVRGQGLVAGPPKSAAGARTVSIPTMVVGELRQHVAEHVAGAGVSTLVFTGPTGAPIRRGNFNKLVGWKDAVAKLGLPELHFHDLRHTGNTFAAKSGVGTKDLMGRMGHDSMQAALIYQRTTDTGDARIKAALEAELAAVDENQADSEGEDNDDGPAGVPVPA